MKDKFEIFERVIFREQNSNYFGIYITIGQLANIMRVVYTIYNSYDDNITLDENVSNHFNRSITPMGDLGRNKL